uniref:Kazal-like domain-containing protein n=1 Tax=Macrostomum lignano TaxID=282301 RepID=A0A1I8H0W0_9PLAT
LTQYEASAADTGVHEKYTESTEALAASGLRSVTGGRVGIVVVGAVVGASVVAAGASVVDAFANCRTVKPQTVSRSSTADTRELLAGVGIATEKGESGKSHGSDHWNRLKVKVFKDKTCLTQINACKTNAKAAPSGKKFTLHRDVGTRKKNAKTKLVTIIFRMAMIRLVPVLLGLSFICQSSEAKKKPSCESSCPVYVRAPDPVCGADGRKYYDECHAKCAGAEVVPCPTTTTRPTKKTPCVCPEIYKPVCGDGKDYGNECMARCDGAVYIVDGPCPTKKPPCLCPLIYKPVCGDGKDYGNECLARCAGAEEIVDGPCLCSCPRYYLPVCGSDGVTYSNMCFARCAGVTCTSRGPCRRAFGDDLGSGALGPTLVHVLFAVATDWCWLSDVDRAAGLAACWRSASVRQIQAGAAQTGHRFGQQGPRDVQVTPAHLAKHMLLLVDLRADAGFRSRTRNDLDASALCATFVVVLFAIGATDGIGSSNTGQLDSHDGLRVVVGVSFGLRVGLVVLGGGIRVGLVVLGGGIRVGLVVLGGGIRVGLVVLGGGIRVGLVVLGGGIRVGLVVLGGGIRVGLVVLGGGIRVGLVVLGGGIRVGLVVLGGGIRVGLVVLGGGIRVGLVVLGGGIRVGLVVLGGGIRVGLVVLGGGIRVGLVVLGGGIRVGLVVLGGGIRVGLVVLGGGIRVGLVVVVGQGTTSTPAHLAWHSS